MMEAYKKGDLAAKRRNLMMACGVTAASAAGTKPKLDTARKRTHKNAKNGRAL
jgi:hypothetical protein